MNILMKISALLWLIILQAKNNLLPEKSPIFIVSFAKIQNTFSMKNIKIAIFTLMALSMLAFTSCNMGGNKSDSKMKEQLVNDTYKISVPDFFEDLNGLNKDASLEMGNELKEFYMIVIDEPAQEFYNIFDEYMLKDLYSRDLTGFTKMVLETMEMDAGIFDIAEYKEIEINGIKAIQTEFYNVFNGLDIYYHFTTLESDNNFYQIMMWTIKSNQKEYENTMAEIAASFSEVK